MEGLIIAFFGSFSRNCMELHTDTGKLHVTGNFFPMQVVIKHLAVASAPYLVRGNQQRSSDR